MFLIGNAEQGRIAYTRKVIFNEKKAVITATGRSIYRAIFKGLSNEEIETVTKIVETAIETDKSCAMEEGLINVNSKEEDR